MKADTWIKITFWGTLLLIVGLPCWAHERPTLVCKSSSNNSYLMEKYEKSFKYIAYLLTSPQLNRVVDANNYQPSYQFCDFNKVKLSKYRAYYSPEWNENTIYLNQDFPWDKKTLTLSLLHELQHLVFFKNLKGLSLTRLSTEEVWGFNEGLSQYWAIYFSGQTAPLQLFAGKFDHHWFSFSEKSAHNYQKALEIFLVLFEQTENPLLALQCIYKNKIASFSDTRLLGCFQNKQPARQNK